MLGNGLELVRKIISLSRAVPNPQNQELFPDTSFGLSRKELLCHCNSIEILDSSKMRLIQDKKATNGKITTVTGTTVHLRTTDTFNKEMHLLSSVIRSISNQKHARNVHVISTSLIS